MPVLTDRLAADQEFALVARHVDLRMLLDDGSVKLLLGIRNGALEECRAPAPDGRVEISH